MSSKLLGSISPAYGLMSGKGAFGKLADSGMGGIIPSLLARNRRKNKEEEEEEMRRAQAEGRAPAMKKGGKVCMASKRADGIAQRGKTRGKVY